MNFFTFIVLLDKLVLTINLTSTFFVFSCIGQFMVGEAKWHLVPSYEDATILIRNYETITVIKFSCFSSEQCIGSRTFCPTKIRFITYYQHLCGNLEAAVHSCFVEQLFGKLLKIFKKVQVVGSDFNKFLQSAAIVKIDVLLCIIFHNCQVNKYMVSPISILLNIPGIYPKVPFDYYLLSL